MVEAFSFDSYTLGNFDPSSERAVDSTAYMIRPVITPWIGQFNRKRTDTHCLESMQD